MYWLRRCLLALAIAICPATVHADDYYMILFYHVGASGAARDNHAFASFVKTEGADKAPTVQTVSWLPETLDVRILRPPERGVNLTLTQSLELANARGARVLAWGPYRIDKELYDRAAAQVDRLNAGAIAYKALDGRFRPGEAINCIHAVSDVISNPLLNTGAEFGPPAMGMIREHFGRWILDDRARHPKVINAIGLDRYRVTYVD